jgi:hypothetical protein
MERGISPRGECGERGGYGGDRRGRGLSGFPGGRGGGRGRFGGRGGGGRYGDRPEVILETDRGKIEIDMVVVRADQPQSEVDLN